MAQYRYEIHECPATYGYVVYRDDEEIASECGYDTRGGAEDTALTQIETTIDAEKEN